MSYTLQEKPETTSAIQEELSSVELQLAQLKQKNYLGELQDTSQLTKLKHRYSQLKMLLAQEQKS